MSRLSVNDVRCEALFASPLQPSEVLTGEAVSEAIGQAIRQLGSRGCAAKMAQEFGDHPEPAAARMRWARQLVRDLLATPPACPPACAGEFRSRGMSPAVEQHRRPSRHAA